jgi:hypothetical protein
VTARANFCAVLRYYGHTKEADQQEAEIQRRTQSEQPQAEAENADETEPETF